MSAKAWSFDKTRGYGHVAELVYAYVSEAYPARVGSSSLPVPIVRMRL